LGSARSPIFFPEIRFLTNDAWPVIRGIADNNAFPILLMNQYGKGKLFMLTIPANFTDLYERPEPVLNAIRSYVMGDFPVHIEALPSRAKSGHPRLFVFLMEHSRSFGRIMRSIRLWNPTLTSQRTRG